MVLTLIFFVVGFFILIKGSDLLIDGASFIAGKLHLSGWLMGVIVAGIGTSIPEFSITLASVVSGKEIIAVGNIIGGGLINILLVLGVSALAAPLVIKKSWINRDMVWNIVSVVIFMILIFLPIGGPFGQISRVEGMILTALFFVWIWRVIKEKTDNEDEAVEYSFSLLTAIVMIVAGFVGVVIGGDWVVSGATSFAQMIGVSEGVIALTIIGVGASIPELAVSLTAAVKKQPGIAVGNVIGTVVFDILFIFGISAIIKPFFFPTTMFFDTLLLALSAILLFLLMFFGQKNVISRKKGMVLIAAYVAYLFYLIMGR